MNKKRSAITGSNGFLGKHLLKRLVALGHSIYTIPHQRFDDPATLIRNLTTFQPDYIFNLASYGNMSYQDNDSEIIKANVVNLCSLLKYTNDIPYKAFINISSSSVGLPNKTMYASTKLMGERIGEAYAEKYGKPIVNLRPFTVVGLHEQDKHLIPTLIRSCMTKEPMKFVPDPVHDYIAVQDVVSAMLVVAENAEQFKGEHIDIGNGVEYSNKDILDIVENVTGRAANIELVEALRSYDTTHWKADTFKIRSMGWKPEHHIPDVIKDMYQYFKEHVHSER